MLETLYQELQAQNLKRYGQVPAYIDSSKATESSRIFDTFRRAIGGKVRSQSMDSQLAGTAKAPSAGHKRNNGLVSVGLPPVGENETSSPNSVTSQKKEACTYLCMALV